jgi:hypothetical protein
LLQLKNHSPFKSIFSLFPNEQGVESLYVVVKGTFNISPVLSVAQKQAPITLADEYWGDPTSSSIKYASDIHLTKPTTDVVLIGQAWTPHERSMTQIDVRFSVAEKQKTLRVTGKRVWKNGSISNPEPFRSMPLVYEYAFGGKHEIDPDEPNILAVEANPVGRGFRGKRRGGELEGMSLPNVEDPQCLIANAGDKATPAAFAFVSPSWQPRLSYVGTYDEAWQENRAPYLPDDFDPRFFNVAHPDFIFDRYLQGGEPVMLENLSREGPLQFVIPTCQLRADISVAGQVESPPLNLETVLIEPEENRLCLTWRCAITCDKKTLSVEQMDIHLDDLQLAGGSA